jgi:hypothetical protein
MNKKRIVRSLDSIMIKCLQEKLSHSNQPSDLTPSGCYQPHSKTQKNR